MADNGAVDPSMAAAIGMGGPMGAMAAAAAFGAATAKQLRVEGETLSTFKKRVDRLLWELEKSQAAPKNIANGVLPNGRLGDFNEAEDLRGAYQKVHGQLESLSKMLGLQIEALLAAVDASKAGYQNADEEVKAQLSRIRTEADAIVDKWQDKGGHGGQGEGGRGERGAEPAPEPTDKEAGGL